MAWKINYTEIAAKQMQKLDKSVSKKIDTYLSERIAIQIDPRTFGSSLLHEKSGLWRYRVEDHRIICDIRDGELVVLVLRVAHRKHVYDK